jgi:hypothetical protein
VVLTTSGRDDPPASRIAFMFSNTFQEKRMRESEGRKVKRERSKEGRMERREREKWGNGAKRKEEKAKWKREKEKVKKRGKKRQRKRQTKRQRKKGKGNGKREKGKRGRLVNREGGVSEVMDTFSVCPATSLEVKSPV